MLAALVILFATGRQNRKRKLDERITLRRQDKIPYGTYVAYRNLKYIFPRATIYTNRYEPGYWDSLSNFDAHQLFISVSARFSADEEEMKRIISFTENGNDVFISTMAVSDDVKRMLDCSTNDFLLPGYFGAQMVGAGDTMNVSLINPPFEKTLNYVYPGKPYGSGFTRINDNTTNALGSCEGLTNFIHLRAGKGNIYIHLSPMAFSNYFILHKNNIEYYEKVLSVVDPGVTRVVWDEYYLNKRRSENNDPEKKKNWFSVLMNTRNNNGQKPFRAAFWLLILLLLFYVLIEMRRKQRIIPVIAKPKNDSLDFVKTIGRLYYDKGDHRNLCKKMGAYFLEHVRNKYKLPTGTLDDEFVKNLQYKSGVEEPEIRGIISFIKYVEDAAIINNNQLSDFHKQLESFYKKA